MNNKHTIEEWAKRVRGPRENRQAIVEVLRAYREQTIAETRKAILGGIDDLPVMGDGWVGKVLVQLVIKNAEALEETT